MQKLIPNFLKRLDQYLVKHHPFIWRTRIHFIGFYSLILGNILAIALGFLYPVDMEEIPSAVTLDLTLLSSSIFAVFVLIWWGFSQYKFKLQSTNLRVLVFTGSIYLIGTFSIWMNVLLFNTAIQYQIADLVEDKQLYSDIEAIQTSGNDASLLYESRGNIPAVATRYKIAEKRRISQYVIANHLHELKQKITLIQSAKHRLSHFPDLRNNIGKSSLPYQRISDDGILLFYLSTFLGLFFIPMFLFFISRIDLIQVVLIAFAQILFLILGIALSIMFNLHTFYDYFPLLTILTGISFLSPSNSRASNFLFGIIVSMIPIFMLLMYFNIFEEFQFNFPVVALISMLSTSFIILGIQIFNKKTINPIHTS